MKYSVWRLFFVAGLFWIAFCDSVFALPTDVVSVKVAVSKATVTIGTRISYKLELTYPESFRVVGELVPPTVPGVEIEERKSTETKKGNSIAVVKNYDLIPFTIGEIQYPSWEIRLADTDDEAVTKVVFAESVNITIAPVRKETDPDDIRPIRGIIDFKSRVIALLEAFGKSAGLSLILGFLLAFILLGVVLYHKNREKRIVRSPFEQAMFELEKIQKSSDYLKGDARIFGDQLTAILRHYVGAFLKFEAMDLTTREIHARMKEAQVLKEYTEQFIKLLTECDLIKFAKYQPEKSRLDALLEESRKTILLLDQTTQQINSVVKTEES